MRQILSALFFVVVTTANALGASLLREALDAGAVGAAPVALARHFDVLEDPTRALTLADVQRADVAARFKASPATAESLNFGLTSSAYWLRLSLKNQSERTLDQLLEIAYPRLIRIDFFRVSAGMPDQVFESGYARPFASRVYQHRFFVFPLAMAPNSEQVIYLRAESLTSLEIPAQLWQRSAFHAHERTDYMVQGAYFGMVVTMIMFNLLLMLSLRDRGYLFYILFAASNAMCMASSTGIGVEYLWGHAPAWSTVSFAFGGHLTGVWLIAFMRHLIGTAQLLPRLDRLLTVFMVLNAFAAAGTLVSYQIALTLVLIITTTLLVLMIAVVCSFKRQRSAYIFLAAFTGLLTGVMMMSLRIGGVLPSSFITVNGVQIGTAIEMIFLAFALADRFHAIRAEKERAQAQLVDSLRTSERLLEGRVNERTSELSAMVIRLQQTQRDLVQSEKLASLGALVAGVAHELNTPIGNALVVASALEDEAGSFRKIVADGALKRTSLDAFLQRCKEMAELLTRSCGRAATLISSFKQVAVDQTSEQQRKFDLLALVADNVASLRPNFKTAAWRIETEVPEGIRCDSYPGPLGQVLVNLVQNAATHAFDAQAEGRLTISATVSEGMVELNVTDTGKGMEAATLARIFEPFFTTRMGQGGSGLGLAICQNIVTGVLGGTLQATSQVGKGTRFVLRFPLSAPHQAKPLTALAAEAPA